MNEVYWITRLDGLNTLFVFLTIFGFLATIVHAFGFALKESNKEYNTEYKLDDDYKTGMTLMKWSRPFLYAAVIAIIGLVFVPTKKEALLIYGLGGTIDYIKDNDKAKQLPDKVIDALDQYLEQIKDDNSNEKD